MSTALLRAELLKLRSVRSGLLVVPVAGVLTLWAAVEPVLQAGRAGSPSLGTAGALLAVLGAVGRGALVSLVAGVLVATTDVRHGTLTCTLLQTPRRAAVLGAKAVVAVLLALAVAAVDLAVVLAVGLLSGAVDPAMVNSDIVVRVAGLLLTHPLYALLGVGLGALLLSQPLAVVLPVLWTVLLERLLVPEGLAAWSLSGVTAALGNAGDVAGVLPVPLGAAALLAYAAAALVLGGARLLRHDVA
jgi:hypothetical protein